MNRGHVIKPVLLLFMIMALPLLTVAQGETAGVKSDALQQLAQTRDTIRIDLLLKISEELLKTQPKEAFGYAQEALDMSRELKDVRRTALACYALAEVYTVTAVYDKALEYQLLALEQFTRLRDSVAMAGCYNHIGVIHMSSGDFDEAQRHYRKALELNRRTKNPAQVVHNYMNMGVNYLETDSVDKGLSYFLVSLMIADSLNLEAEKVALLKYIGYGYARMNRHEEALGNFYKVLELLGDKPDDLTRSEAQVNIARGYYQLKNYPAALKYARLGYDLAKSGRFDEIYSEAARILAEIYAATGDYRQAFTFGREHALLADTIMNAEKAEQLARIRTLYEVSQKEEENRSLRQLNLLTNKRIRTRTLVIIMITMLVVVLGVVLYLLNRMNNRYAALNKKLAAQGEELGALNDMKDRFFSFVGHNLRNPFNTIMGFAELMQRAAETHDSEKVLQYAGLIRNLSAQVQKVLANLLEWSRLQRRTFEVKPETVEMMGLIRDVAEMNNREAARKDINLSVTGNGNVFVIADRTMVATVLQNLVSNAIYHTPAAGKINISCCVMEQHTEVAISDTGTGIPPEKLEKLFDFDFTRSKANLSDQEGVGIGLVICHEMLAKNGGTIRAESTPGKGSRFVFTLPLAIRRDTDEEMTEHNPEATADKMAERLVDSASPFSAEVKEEFKQQVVPLFEEVTRALSIENLDRFARAIIVAGEQHALPALSGYGKSLHTLTIGHQIDQVIKVLPRFGEYLKKTGVVNE